MPDQTQSDPRLVMHRQGKAALATLMDGQPYVSLVLVAFDVEGRPLLFLSDLAQHSRNLTDDTRVSLLFVGTEGFDEPLTGPRLTIVGRAEPCDDPAAQERYVTRHPSAADYAGFRDFRLYRVEIARGHFVAGFGRIAWIEAQDLRRPL